MKTNTTKSIFVILLLLFTFNSSSMQFDEIQTNQSLQFYLTSDEGFGLNITTLNANGNDFIEMNVRDSDGQEVTTNLTIGDTMVFGVNGTLPEWSGSTTGRLNLSMLILGGESEFSYWKPWELDPTTINLDGPPALMWPMIPIGEQFYWDTIAADFQGLGYGMNDDGTEFTISFTNESLTASVMYDKPTGLMKKYAFEGNILSDGQTIPLTFSLEFAWVLSPSHATTLGWYSESALLDYEVIEAKYNNGSDGFSLDFNMGEFKGSGPIYGYGEIFKGETIQGSFHDFRGFMIDGPPGYIFELDGPNGHMGFNISIDLPSSDPQFHNRFFIPMMPKTELALLKGYFGVSDVMSEGYSHVITGSDITLTYIDEYISISATWDISSGILTHWKGVETSNDGSNIEFEIVDYESLDNFDLHWGIDIGDGLTLQVNGLEVDGSNQLELDGGGYIIEGDLIYMEVIGFADEENGPPGVFYMIDGPNGHQNNASMLYTYPGTQEFDGPPLFLPYSLLGNSNFHNWLENLYSHAGGTYTKTNDEITLQWTFEMEDSSTTELAIVWRTSDGAIQSYIVTNTLSDNTIQYHLDFEYVGDGQITDLDTEDSPGLPVNTYIVLITIIAVPILRRNKIFKL